MKKVVMMACMAASVLFASCEGEQGEVGPQGPQGEQGPTGSQGPQGEPGEGYEAATRFGYLTVELEGTMPNGSATFEDSVAYQYAATEPGDIGNINSTATADVYSAWFTRFFGSVDDVYNERYANMSFNIDNSGATPEITLGSYELYNYQYITEDNRYFVLNDTWTSSSVTSFTATNVSFDPATRFVSFDYSMQVGEASNDTGYPLMVSGTAEIQLLEQM